MPGMRGDLHRIYLPNVERLDNLNRKMVEIGGDGPVRLGNGIINSACVDIIAMYFTKELVRIHLIINLHGRPSLNTIRVMRLRDNMLCPIL